MKTASLAVAVVALLSGCATSRQYTLPPIQAKKVTVIHTDPAGKIEASASDVVITDEAVTAGSARWEVSYPFWHDLVIAEGYRRERKAEAQK